ncbi:MAG: TIGR03560 family F420-dependent LLM class oxidoreductase [Deltaproteobacteria bacterium]|nr:TIGR03560 family F420-dependent LLM class oxidoreductase [Deltaproteobacteria bacterium]
MADVKRITFKTAPERTEWSRLLDTWLEAEQIEALDGGWLFDHFYPIYGDPTGPCFEGWTALSYLAGRTKRLRLGLLVTGNPYRHPSVLANMAATFDVFSGGRLDLGLGAGWNQIEADALGLELLPIRDRLSQFEEACGVVDSLLTKETTTFTGRFYRLTDARCAPKPVQRPRPPFIIGGVGEKRMLRICARWADDWNFPGGSPEMFREKVAILHRHCAEIGRDPSEITLSTHVFAGDDPAKTAADSVGFAEAGAQHLVLYFLSPAAPGLLGRTVEAVTAALR